MKLFHSKDHDQPYIWADSHLLSSLSLSFDWITMSINSLSQSWQESPSPSPNTIHTSKIRAGEKVRVVDFLPLPGFELLTL